MRYNNYRILLNYLDKDFLDNLRSIIINQNIKENNITKKFLYIIKMFNHEKYIRNISRTLIEHYENMLVNIYTGMKGLPIISSVNKEKDCIIRYIPTLRNSYYITYNGKKYNYSIPFIVKRLIAAVGEKWVKM